MNHSQTPSPRSKELEHAAPEAKREAEQLLSDAGSPSEARRAVDSATGPPAPSSPRGDAFARQLNFGSYLEMFEASKPLRSDDGKHWLVTHIGGKQWIVWNDEELTAAYTAASAQEAQELLGAAPAAGGRKEPPPTG